ncbi:uncharacterized protein LOC111608146 isoform X2 [Xiphophorus maculatus]|uniref:uncharacterized protein LOC111608146 isoform X2 n=1 Tax=Xiphophorus maculatus TaxID=8083 RepID=UPI000C6C905C|nr:uncharacterized protein LOC111608146 isoform X2 [Xiphophorus maculatus]
MIKITVFYMLCKWENLKNQQCIKYLFSPLYLLMYFVYISCSYFHLFYSEMPLGKQSDLIHKVATMAAAKDVLLETLEDLNEPEFMELKLLVQFTNFQRNIPLISWHELDYADKTRMVDHLVDKCGKQSVDVIREVLLDLNRTDLALRLSETSSTSKEKLSMKLNSAFLQKVEKLEFVMELLLETLDELHEGEIWWFLEITHRKFLHDSGFIPFWAFPNVRYIVVVFVLTYFHRSVKKTLDALKEMKKDGLMKKLSDRSSGPKEKPSAGRHRSALIHKVATMAAARQQLLETLDKLTRKEFLGKFKGNLSKFSPRLMFITQRAELVDEMMEEFGQRSVKMIKDLLIKINRKDLAENLQETGESSGNEDDFQDPSESDVHQNLSEILQKLNRKPLLRFKSFLQFTCFEKSLPQIPESSLEEATSTQRLVDLMLKEFGQQSVQMAREVLMDVTDLESRFKSQDKLSVAEELSLDQRIEKLSSDFNLLLETLKDLSDDEVREFKRLLRDSDYRSSLSRHQYSLQETSYPRKMFGYFRHEDLEKQPMWMESKNLQDVVIFIIQTHRKESIMVTRDVLEDINRMDLVQRLSSSSASREMPLGKQSDLIHKVATMAAAKDVLLETLEDLNEPEFMELKLLVQFTNFQRNIPLISWYELDVANRTRMVDHLVDKCGKQSVDVIREVLLDLNRTDLALRLSETSSTSKEKLSMKLNSAFLQKVEKLEFVMELLLETLDELHEGEIWWFLEITHRKFLHDSGFIPFWAFPNVRYIVVVFVLTYFHRSVKKTLDALKEMKKDGLMKKLSDRSSGPKEKPSAGRHRSALIHKVATMAAARQQLLETLDKLTRKEFLGKFKGNLSKFSPRLMFITQRAELVDEMMEEFGQRSVKMIKDLLIKINRKDLAENLQETGESSGNEDDGTSLMGMTDPDQMQLETAHKSQATSTEMDPSGYGGVEDSSSWTKVDPELDGTSPDEDPTYSLQSAAGRFECSVSGLRWVCREKVGFRYRFCSWYGHMERMEGRGYRPAGPLLDISVLTGKVMEVQLPHWVCIDDVPELLKNFAVLHVNDCGDVLEKATRVTKTHVGLTEPVFSLLGALINVLFPPRISCNTLIYYQPKTSYLKMRFYLIPLDPALKQSVHSRESSKGYEEIMKPRPDKPLKMGCGFSLQATVQTARIQPPEITLRHDSLDPNFYELFIKNPGEGFNLELLQTQSEKVWFCEIRKDDHPKSGSTEARGCSTETVTVKKEEEHFVDKHRETLIQRVRNIGPVLDGLLQKKVLVEETYDWIRSLPTSESQLREIFSCLKAAEDCKDIFLSILQEKERYLITDLQSKC